MSASSGDSSSPLVEIRGVRREYAMGPTTVHALDGIDLEIHRGERIVFLGVSGSGKSTLLHLLGGLDTPTAGEVRVDGRDLGEMTSRERAHFRRQSVGFIFQSYYLVPSLTAIRNVSLALTLQGTYGEDRKRRASEAIERVGLGHRAGHRPGQMSGGEQQRVAIARAIVHRPPLLLADEPTGNLDRATRDDVERLILELHEELESTVVLVTHDEEMAHRIADRIVRLRDGRVEGIETP